MNDENLKPCKPGETHNPNGRPKGSLNIKTLIEKVLNEEIELDDPIINKRAKKKIIEHGLRRQAIRWLNGDNQAGKDFLDRGFGKPKETVTLNNNISITNDTLNKILKSLTKRKK
jgi:hypothetical protein